MPRKTINRAHYSISTYRASMRPRPDAAENTELTAVAARHDRLQ